ncbi:MAG: hypothetical protein OXK78_07540 [Caldilineaceae bacterium]|nr:hypothetical protein [Caldilineaceae bacterium]
MNNTEMQALVDKIAPELSEYNIDWDNLPTLDDAIAQVNSRSQPCDRQPGEPLEQYRWFQIWVTLPLPRRHATVAEIAGLRPNTRLIARAANQWRWPERLAEAARQEDQFLVLRVEWGEQLLRETAYTAHFTGLQDTSRALSRAEIDKLDRAEARRNLPSLLHYLRGLLTLVEARRKENAALKINERRLRGMVLDRRIVYAAKLFRLEWEAMFGPTEFEHDPIVDGPKQKSEEDPSQTEPWRRQPEESDQQYYWFQIYLGLQFLQSTAQVAKMAGVRQKSALANTARRWNWQERAAAYDAHHAGAPLARIQLRLRLLHDKAFEAHLQGLLGASSAIEKAGIGSMDRSTARQGLSTLLRHQGSLLKSFWRQHEAIAGKSVDEHRDLLLAAQVDKEAIQMLREEEESEDVMLKLLYGPKDGEE